MRHISSRYRQLHAAVVTRVLMARADDRGEINSSVAWTGAMVLAAVTISGIIVAAATGFAENIDFGG